MHQNISTNNSRRGTSSAIRPASLIYLKHQPAHNSQDIEFTEWPPKYEQQPIAPSVTSIKSGEKATKSEQQKFWFLVERKNRKNVVN